ncbi:thioredoxin reductase (NADPH)/thioredoxin 1 [Nocardioides thalensis]|uniref:Thioredoxin n=1 Tax=Nocardioides thalensis TaxID=1914755 RepID=A0A853C603_9ACTN|nr:thioredoxin [Nocardioides thalensis]NYJ03500.1 thioredoxin reductase (NADPH)/thioredoxin 1 [Nocardioides thalensis]
MPSLDLTADNFERTVLDNEIVLVDFWASWCGPCRMFAPIYEEAAQANDDIVFGSVNTEEERGLSAAAQIQSIPTLMAFKKGTLVFSQAGALPAPALTELIGKVRELDIDAALAQQGDEATGDKAE